MKVFIIGLALFCVASAVTIVAQDNNIADFIQAKYCNNNGGNGGAVLNSPIALDR